MTLLGATLWPLMLRTSRQVEYDVQGLFIIVYDGELGAGGCFVARSFRCLVRDPESGYKSLGIGRHPVPGVQGKTRQLSS